MKDFEEIKKISKVSTKIIKITRYEFTLKNDEYYCKNCRTIYKSDNVPDFCSKCGGHWHDSFKLPIENPIVIEDEDERLVDEKEERKAIEEILHSCEW